MEVVNIITEVAKSFGAIVEFHNFVKNFHEKHNIFPIEAYLQSLGNLVDESRDYHEILMLFIKQSLKNSDAFNEMFQLKKSGKEYSMHVSEVAKTLSDIKIV